MYASDGQPDDVMMNSKSNSLWKIILETFYCLQILFAVYRQLFCCYFYVKAGYCSENIAWAKCEA